jgi:hypothetical protein
MLLVELRPSALDRSITSDLLAASRRVDEQPFAVPSITEVIEFVNQTPDSLEPQAFSTTYSGHRGVVGVSWVPPGGGAPWVTRG